MAGAGEKKGGNKMQKSYFDVLGICCSSEVPMIEKMLKPLEGVKDVSVVVPSRTVIVVHDSLIISQVQIVKVLNQARLEANIRLYGGKSHRKKWPSPFAVACGVLLLLSFIKYVYRPFQWLALGAVAVGIFPIVLKALAALRSFRLDINILMLIAGSYKLTCAVVQSSSDGHAHRTPFMFPDQSIENPNSFKLTYSQCAVAGSIALKDYWEAGTIVFLFTIAEWLESRASHKATAVMSSLVNIVPQRALLAETGEAVDASEVMVNTVLAVKAGEIIPIDGIVVEGNCEVDEKTLTGESFPAAKQIDSNVWAGTINLNGYITVKTTALAEDSVVSRMARLVEDAQNNKSKTQTFIENCAKYYTPAVVVISTCLAVIPAALRLHNRTEWYHLALVVLVSACPCALILSTPVATFCALSMAATSGLLVKGAEHLETLARVRIMAFDKTGTITRGEFTVADFQSLLEDVDLNALLYWVSSVESKSSHPMAAALIDYAHSHSLEPKPDQVEEFQDFPGEGIYGKIDGKDLYVGNRKIAIRAGCAAVPTSEGTDDKEGKSIGYIFLGSSLAGIFSISDICRTGVQEAIKELKSMGIKTAMLTGDSCAAAKHAQDQLKGALDLVHAELLPQDKARIIKEFQKETPTAMIGDGVNDAAALATADIGISMGISGSALATETGNIILMSNDIRKIPKAARLARRTRRKIIENVVLAISTKAGIIALAIAGHPLVWAAVLADVGTCLLVILNSMLLLRGTSQTSGRKFSKSSCEPHGHKQGCSTAGSDSSHTHKRCCSGTEAQKKSTPEKCSSKKCPPKCVSNHSSSMSSGNKNSDSGHKHNSCGHFEKVREGKHPGHGKDTGPRSVHNHGYMDDLQHFCSSIEAQAEDNPQKCSSGMFAPGCQSRDLTSVLRHDDVGQTREAKHQQSVDNHVCTVPPITSSHKHQHCCSSSAVEKKCTPQKHSLEMCPQTYISSPSSSIPCEKNKYLDPADQEHSGSFYSHKLHQAKLADHSSCDILLEDRRLHGANNRTCRNSVETHHDCVHNHLHHEAESMRLHSTVCVDSDHSVGFSETNQHMASDDHCHSNHCTTNHLQHYITEEEIGNIVKTCCKYHLSQDQKVQPKCQNQCKEYDSSLHSDTNHVESTAIRACTSLEKRQPGACCKSYREGSCSTHFRASFKGGLSEIVIE
ncbi:hypothetical protein RJ640_001726 [Escallonia rubra]|uniref:HMA domain-containing protein n=1 Tax=Escallonia rubra TaxID=112253 RepID=A0AA88QTU3_9ASTE|nr:hypothetical protein RJ640_001726 [Escallonia rubra]